MAEELETREKLKLINVAKEWLRTEHSEGNIQSLVNLISSFTEPREKRIAELKILISSLVYEINQIWDINEMNDDLRRCAEKIDREVQLSKMSEDNRIVISALGFAVVPPKPKLDVKEI